MLRNIDEIDSADRLKLSCFPKFKKEDLSLLSNIRNYTHYRNDLMGIVFVFWRAKIKKQDRRKTLHVTSQLPVMDAVSFVQFMRQNLQQPHFKEILNRLQSFKLNCKQFIQSDVVDYCCQTQAIPQKSIQFAVYTTRDATFVVKAFISSYAFDIFAKKSNKKVERPAPFTIEDKVLIEALKKRLGERVNLPIMNNEREIIEKSRQFYNSYYFDMDEKMLDIKLKFNYPTLRLKYFIPVGFKDCITGESLRGTIYSNSDKQCMYGHLSGGYNAQTTTEMEGQPCPECRITIEHLEQNALLTFLRDNLFNPCKQSILYCPEYNRFKLIPSKNKSSYSCYQHFRTNLRKITPQSRQSVTLKQKFQAKPMTFKFNGVTLLITDPARGKYCTHYAFADLRLFYLSRDEDNLYQCPICQNKMPDSEVFYLREVQIITQYLRWKTQQHPTAISDCSIMIDHELQKVYLEYGEVSKSEAKNQLNKLTIKKTKLEINQFYPTLQDPYVRFDEYKLGIPNKKHQKMQRRFRFGGLGLQQQDEEIDSDEQEENEQGEMSD